MHRIAVHLPICPSVHLSTHLSVLHPICPSVCLSVCLSIIPSAYQCVHWSVHHPVVTDPQHQGQKQGCSDEGLGPCPLCPF